MCILCYILPKWNQTCFDFLTSSTHSKRQFANKLLYFKVFLNVKDQLVFSLVLVLLSCFSQPGIQRIHPCTVLFTISPVHHKVIIKVISWSRGSTSVHSHSYHIFFRHLHRRLLTAVQCAVLTVVEICGLLSFLTLLCFMYFSHTTGIPLKSK